MTSFKNKQAHTFMMRARLALTMREAFFGVLAMQLELIECEKEFCETMAVDGKHLWYYPEFVIGLEEEHRTTVVAHEVLHCCYKHMTRRGHRNPTKWNWAGDFIINDDLTKANFKFPGKPITLKSPPGTKGYLFDPQYSGMSTEEVYERLPDPLTILIKVVGAGDGKGNGQGNGQGLPQGADWGGMGGVIDAVPNHDTAGREDVENSWDGNVRMAVAIAKTAHAGTLPAYLQRLAKELSKPKIDWRARLRDFVDGHMTKDYSWQRPNRRFVHTGLVLPGSIPDAIHHLGFFADVSGSITPPIMKAYGGEVQGCLDQGVADMLTVLFFDAAVQKVDEYMPGDMMDLRTTGGGGTDFRPMFEWVKTKAKHLPEFSCIVVLTDMMPCSWDLPDPGVPVLWGAYVGEEYLKNVKPPFGDILHIDSANW